MNPTTFSKMKRRETNISQPRAGDIQLELLNKNGKFRVKTQKQSPIHGGWETTGAVRFYNFSDAEKYKNNINLAGYRRILVEM